MTDILLVLAGLLALYAGGELLVRAAAALGLRAGLSILVTGLTIVALGTSAPELAVSIDAALVGSPDIAIGNVVGSNFANIALVLAIASLLTPIAIESFVLRRDLPIMMLGFIAIAATLLPDGRISLLEGAAFLAFLTIYIAWVIRVSRRQLAGSAEENDPIVHEPLAKEVAKLVGGILLLSLGGHWMVEGAVHIAARLGVSEALIGMTVVAVGTSLPEITASVISILRGHGAMAVGNVVGSNIWNTFGVLGATAVVSPLPRGDISLSMLAVMGLAGVVLWIFCFTSRQVNRWEGAALLAGYVACQAWLFSA